MNSLDCMYYFFQTFSPKIIMVDLNGLPIVIFKQNHKLFSLLQTVMVDDFTISVGSTLTLSICETNNSACSVR